MAAQRAAQMQQMPGGPPGAQPQPQQPPA
jgi:hypothetical protein